MIGHDMKIDPLYYILKERLKYFPNTGKFIWINPLNKKMQGLNAGYNKRHYRKYDHYRCYIQIDDKKHSRSRLAFLYMKKRFPKFIDHINGNTLDDRWENLRECTPVENAKNINLSFRNGKKSKYPIGIYKNGNKFYYSIRVNKKSIGCIGKGFSSVKEAKIAYIKKRKELFGEFFGRLK